jgi:hypothetical protein
MDLGVYLALGERNISNTEEGKLAVEGFRLILNAMGAAPVDLPGTFHNQAKKVTV